MLTTRHATTHTWSLVARSVWSGHALLPWSMCKLSDLWHIPTALPASLTNLACDLGRYRGANVNFVRVWLRSGGFFEAHRANELVEIVDDALVEPVELGLLVGL